MVYVWEIIFGHHSARMYYYYKNRKVALRAERAQRAKKKRYFSRKVKVCPQIASDDLLE